MNPQIYVGLPIEEQSSIRPDMMPLIAQTVSDYFNIDLNDLRGQIRKREYVEARQVAMYFVKHNTKLSLKKIGGYFGGRDHSTVLYSIYTVEDLKDTDKKYRARFKHLERILNQ